MYSLKDLSISFRMINDKNWFGIFLSSIFLIGKVNSYVYEYIYKRNKISKMLTCTYGFFLFGCSLPILWLWKGNMRSIFFFLLCEVGPFICWSLWKIRNKRVLERYEPNWEHEMEMIKFMSILDYLLYLLLSCIINLSILLDWCRCWHCNGIFLILLFLF